MTTRCQCGKYTNGPCRYCNPILHAVQAVARWWTGVKRARRPEGYAAAPCWVCGCGTRVHGGKSATCPHCGADWFYQPNIQIHVKTHSGEQ